MAVPAARSGPLPGAVVGVRSVTIPTSPVAPSAAEECAYGGRRSIPSAIDICLGYHASMNRVNAYLNSVADLLAAEAEAASHSGHRTTVGHNREHFVSDFLNRHLPSRLQAQLGGTVVSHSGLESSQIDVLVTNDLGLRFEANNTPFVMTEAVAAAISVKSNLNKGLSTNPWMAYSPSRSRLLRY